MLEVKIPTGLVETTTEGREHGEVILVAGGEGYVSLNVTVNDETFLVTMSRYWYEFWLIGRHGRVRIKLTEEIDCRFRELECVTEGKKYPELIESLRSMMTEAYMRTFYKKN